MGDSNDRNDRISIDDVGRESAVLSAIEIGLGSLLHGLRVPFSGHFLSLNQGFLLSRGVWKEREKKGVRLFAARISTIAALLKSLSPAGKKLTPMLAISAQGVLYTMGIILCGPNLPGMVVGICLSSLWAFLQPVLIYYLLFGQALIDMGAYYLKQLQEIFPITENHLIWAVGSFIAAKLIMGIGLAMLARFASKSSVDAYERALLQAGQAKRSRFGKTSPTHSWWDHTKGALQDLFNPIFLMSLVMTAAFFLYSESSLSIRIWILIRPLAVGFLLFFLVRAIPPDWFPSAARLAMERFKGLG